MACNRIYAVYATRSYIYYMFFRKNSKVFLHKNIIVYTCIICTKHPFSAGEAVSRSACFMLHLIEDAGPSYDLPAHIADML